MEIQDRVTKVIEEQMYKEKELALTDIKEATDRQIDRINGTYSSVIKTLNHLKMLEGNVLELYEKSNGNVRLYEIGPELVGREFLRELQVTIEGRSLGSSGSLVLNSQKRYKIFVVVMEDTGESCTK